MIKITNAARTHENEDNVGKRVHMACSVDLGLRSIGAEEKDGIKLVRTDDPNTSRL
jgi:hypothetical protein